MYLGSVYPLTVPLRLHKGSVYVGTWDLAMWVNNLKIYCVKLIDNNYVQRI